MFSGHSCTYVNPDLILSLAYLYLIFILSLSYLYLIYILFLSYLYLIFILLLPQMRILSVIYRYLYPWPSGYHPWATASSTLITTARNSWHSWRRVHGMWKKRKEITPSTRHCLKSERWAAYFSSLLVVGVIDWKLFLKQMSSDGLITGNWNWNWSSRLPSKTPENVTVEKSGGR
jgi:hypothetical protein